MHTPEPTPTTSPRARLTPVSLRRVAWATWIVSMLLLLWGVVFFCLSGGGALQLTSELSIVGAFACFGTVGMLITVQRPHNTVGWLLSAIGIGTGLTSFSSAYTQYGPSLPGAAILNVLGDGVWPINVILLVIFLPLVFPDGRLLSRRWRIVGWWAGIALLLFELTSLLAALPSARLEFFGQVVTSDFWNTVNQSLQFVLLPVILLAPLAVILRFRRSKGLERAQMKWLAYGSTLAIGLVVVSIFVNDPTNFLFAAASICLPLSVGTSILRARLYDIDRLISRTLVYLLLSALLALTYLGLVFALQFLLQGMTQSSPVATVISTLTIAALFQPLRRAIQRLIDRRFYRRKYDAEKTLATFSATLRQEVDLEQVRAHLLAVVQETMQLEHVSLWLRPPERHRGNGAHHPEPYGQASPESGKN